MVDVWETLPFEWNRDIRIAMIGEWWVIVWLIRYSCTCLIEGSGVFCGVLWSSKRVNCGINSRSLWNTATISAWYACRDSFGAFLMVCRACSTHVTSSLVDISFDARNQAEGALNFLRRQTIEVGECSASGTIGRCRTGARKIKDDLGWKRVLSNPCLINATCSMCAATFATY